MVLSKIQSRSETPGKVVVLGGRGIPATWGGVERQWEELYTRLVTRGWDVLLYGRGTYVDPGTTSYRGVSIKVLPTLRSKYLEAFCHTALAVLHAAFKVRPAVLHFYSQGPCLLIPLARLLMPEARIVYTCGGLDWRRRKWPGWASWIIRLGEINSAIFTHRRIMVSQALVRHYREQYGKDSVFIPNGVTLPSLGTTRPPSNPALKPGKYFLTVSRLVPEKRIEDLLEALKTVQSGYTLAVVGSSETAGYRYLERLQQTYGNDPRIVFCGYVFGEELAALYSHARAFVTASELEGMPISLLEAMSYGLPCIASDIEPHREVLGNGYGWLFPMGDIETMARRMNTACDMSETSLAHLGHACRQRVAEEFSWRRAVDALEEVYEELLTMPGKAAVVS